MKSAACGSDESPHTALISSTILDPLMIKEPSSEEKKRFGIALKTLRFSPKMHELQVTVSYPTSAQLCPLAKYDLSESWSEDDELSERWSGPNLEEREEQAAGKRAVKSTA